MKNLTALEYRYFKLKNISIQYNDKKISLVLSNHLYKKRDNQDFKRGYMFKTMGQWKDFFLYALKNYNILDFINKGKTSIIFNHFGDRYSMLINIESNYYTKPGYDLSITVITIDKIEKRHFTNNMIFGKESNRVTMQNYSTKKSFLKFAKENVSSVKFKINQTDKSDSFNLILTNVKNDQIKALLKELVSESLIQYIVSKIILKRDKYEIFNNGDFWIKIRTKENEYKFLNISIEQMFEHRFAFIILNIFDFNKKNEEYILSKNNYLDIVFNRILILSKKVNLLGLRKVTKI